jgi:hypothetical protein
VTGSGEILRIALAADEHSEIDCQLDGIRGQHRGRREASRIQPDHGDPILESKLRAIS